MVFRRPGNSRDDKSNRSSNRASKGDDQSKRTGAPRSSKPSNSGSDKAGERPKRSSYGSAASGGQKSTSSERRKPYSGRPDSGGDSSTRRTSSGSAPYRSKSNTDERPKRSFGDDTAGEKRSYKPRSTPYSGRPTSDDRPKRSFSGESSGEKKSFKPRSTPYSGRPTSDDRPKRSFGGESSGEKKSFKPRSTPYSGRPTSDDRPKRSFSSESTGERKFSDKPSFKSAEGSGDRKFNRRPAEGAGFKKRIEDPAYKPFRNSENSSYNKPKTERDPDAKTLRGRKKPATKEDSGLIRLNRYISNAGICSRRKADELIAAGVVSVNGEVISELGHKIDPTKDAVRYNGELLKREKMVYVLLNKPKDYITTTDDPQERRTVMHLVEKASKERIYPIGRLDRNTTGLLLMTNDGDLADKLSHPKNNIVKLYQVELSKALTQGDLNKISFGLELEDGLIKPDSIAYVQGATKKEVGIQIHSGKNRIVRRIFEHLGYEVVKLDRAVYANLTKKDLPRGRWRYLDEKEVIQLKHLI
ncbi:pseudouridine synthase [Mucilaginibacter sp. McL0603]|uniref:pseudouridine synthase n=1 Tax=Mucilaginibacter sp. McL0603 TaxID=3415670 RepID=UPI003CF36E8C